MNLSQLRTLVRQAINDWSGDRFSDDIIDQVINDGLRILCRETLLLESKNESLVYSDPGWNLPADFIQIRALLWPLSNGNHIILNRHNLEEILKLRKRIEALGLKTIPRFYTITNKQIILDSPDSTQSPILYYWKYDAKLTSDTSEPSIPEEYHHLLRDYAAMELLKGNPENFEVYKQFVLEWQDGLHQIRRQQTTDNIKVIPRFL